MPSRTGLATRLRAETADLHRATEDAVGLPDAVQTVAAYGTLLSSSLVFYAAARSALEDARWSEGWLALGIRIKSHDRVLLLQDDLRILGIEPGPPPVPLRVASFAEALGLLYVVEGSSLGGRFIAPAIVRAIGAVPVSFYLGEARNHPLPWRDVGAALALFDTSENDTDAVLTGARNAFVAFGEFVSVTPRIAL